MIGAAGVYQWLVPRVVAPLGARLGHPRWTTTRALGTRQWETPEAVEARAMARLRTLLAHAAAHVPYYRDLVEDAEVSPDAMRQVTDLARLPFTTKVDLRAGHPGRTTAENLPASRRLPMMTSGSTGLPFEFYWDRDAVAGLGGTDWFWLDWAGTAPWHTRIVIASPAYFYERVTPRRWSALTARYVLGERTERLSADRLSTEALRSLVGRVHARGPYYIRGYPGALSGLAARLEGEGVRLAGDPQVVITFAETATPAAVEAIRRGFRARVVNYYSCWEVPQIAQTCPDAADRLHVNAERVIARVVRTDGSDAAPGEVGRVVVTDLANRVMPFINYVTGDRAVAGGPCPCGRGWPTLLRIEGRDSEVVRTREGREISGVMLGQFLAFVAGTIPYIQEYQAVQTAPGDVTLRVVPTSRFTAAFQHALERQLLDFLGPDMSVTVEPVDAIPLEPSGKRMIIKPLAA